MTTLKETTDTDLTIHHLNESWDGRQRFLELGGIPGTPIKVSKRSRFGGAIIIYLRDMKLAIRRKDAQNIVVQQAA